MLGNPYSSNDPDLGPNMREIKNKICTDCELVALLEDDNGMELLVNNKIISLDLPVKDVYQKVWLPVAQENEPMRIIYRMRGLLGEIGISPNTLEPCLGFYLTSKPSGSDITSELMNFKTSGEARRARSFEIF